MKPSMRPFALRLRVCARELEEMIGRKAGRSSSGVAPSFQSAGSKRICVSSPGTEPVTVSGYSATPWRAKASSTPGIRMGIPAPMMTTATPASMAP